MPPRQPVKNATNRRRIRTMLPVEVAGNPLENLPPVKPQRAPSFSPYPDLSMAISMLEKRQKHVSGERLNILTRWLETLQRLQAEMQKLHKLEVLANRLSPTTEPQP